MILLWTSLISHFSLMRRNLWLLRCVKSTFPMCNVVTIFWHIHLWLEQLWLGHWKSNLGLLILWSRCNSLVGFVIHFLKKLSKYDTNFQVMDKNVVEEISHWKIKKPHNLYNINRLFLSFPIDFKMESNEFLPNNKLVCILVLMSWP